MPVVAIVGDSGSGKTLLAQQVVAALVADGLRVGFVKHAPHGFEPRRSDADSELVLAAGADPVVVLGPDGTMQLSQRLTGLRGDVVLLEGFSASPWPKVRVSIEGRSPRDVADPVLLDVSRVADEPFDDDAVRAVLAVLADQQRGERQDPRTCVRFSALWRSFTSPCGRLLVGVLPMSCPWFAHDHALGEERQ